MPDPVIITKYDVAVEEHAMRKHGMLGRGSNANSVFAISYGSLPPEARTVIGHIVAKGPFCSPGHDGGIFGNRYGDLPSGVYLEFTVPTPGVTNRGARRIVARKTTGQLFFTACHYERIEAKGGTAPERATAIQSAAASIDSDYQNGFYIITGLTADLRNDISLAIKTKY